MPTILGDRVLLIMTLPVIMHLAVAFEAAADNATPDILSPASTASQLAALDYIEKLAIARSRGVTAVADALGLSGSADAGLMLRNGVSREFGDVGLMTELDQADRELVLVVRVSHGCIQRAVAKEKMALAKIVWGPLADSPAPVFGYAHFTGGSASTIFFDASGSRCMAGVRIEGPARLREAIESTSSR